MSTEPIPGRNQPFGEYFHALRERSGSMTLREFCSKHNLDPGTISKMERGLLPPPRSLPKISALAATVGITEESPEWQEFLDMAYAARGEIPPDLASEEDVVQRLPAIFRTLRGTAPSEEDVRLLMQLIRES